MLSQTFCFGVSSGLLQCEISSFLLKPLVKYTFSQLSVIQISQ